MKLQYRVATAVASTALMLNLAVPAFASTTVDVVGNGKKSDNTVNVTNKNTVKVNQTNSSVVVVGITSTANSGGNKANGNTGGDVSVKTGDATATASLAVTGSANVANIASCGCEEDTTVKVKDNGKKSKNKTDIKNTSNQTADQTNGSTVSGTVDAKAKSGKNKANDNTNGTTDVNTGNADSSTTVEVTSPANVLNP